MIRWWLLVAACCLGGCIGDQLVPCGDVACPAATVCDPIHGACITADQATACGGAPDNTTCTADGRSGYCLGGVCEHVECGNHVVDPGEQCDDGNVTSDDGCNGSCTSTERCGNGVVDASYGELCDDGNLLSQDGCDSRCLPETVTWTLEPISPDANTPAVYDAAAHELVNIGWDGSVWGRTTGRWQMHVAPQPGTSYQVIQTFYDSSRGIVMSLGGLGGQAVTLREWDGTAAIDRPMVGTPALQYVFAAAYDGANHQILVVGGPTGGNMPETWALDATTATWTQLADLPSDVVWCAGAGDELRGRVVVVCALTAGGTVVHEWTGASWSTVSSSLLVPSGYFTIAYDPAVSSVVVAVGDDSGTMVELSKWTGSAWVTMATVPAAVSQMYFDTDRGRLVFPHGETFIEWDGVSTTTVHTGIPDLITVSVYDAGVGRMIGTTEGGQSWSFAGGVWTQLDDCPGTPIAYDPIRGGVIATYTTGNNPHQMIHTLLLGGSHWTEILSPELGPYGAVATYDPELRRIVMVAEFWIWVLPSDGDHWVKFLDLRSILVRAGMFDSLAFDASDHCVVSATSQLVSDEWSDMLSPQAVEYVVADPRRGSVLFYDDTHLWEHVGDTWSELAPTGFSNLRAVYDDRNGELLVFSTAGSFNVLHRRYTSATPSETCVAGEDADGDGLAGCADPDCYAACNPACPPHVSCP